MIWCVLCTLKRQNPKALKPVHGLKAGNRHGLRKGGRHTAMLFFLNGTLATSNREMITSDHTGTGRISGLVTCILSTRVGYMMDVLPLVVDTR